MATKTITQKQINAAIKKAKEGAQTIVMDDNHHDFRTALEYWQGMGQSIRWEWSINAKRWKRIKTIRDKEGKLRLGEKNHPFMNYIPFNMSELVKNEEVITRAIFNGELWGPHLKSDGTPITHDQIGLNEDTGETGTQMYASCVFRQLVEDELISGHESQYPLVILLCELWNQKRKKGWPAISTEQVVDSKFGAKRAKQESIETVVSALDEAFGKAKK